MRKIVSILLPGVFGACALAGAAMAADQTADAAANSQNPRAAKRAEYRQRFFDQIDTNHDGVVSRAEYQAWVDARFAKLDTNGDGHIDANEIATSPAAAARAQKRAEAFVKHFDQDGSGTVSKSDFEAKAMARFDHLGNGADSLTEDQLAMPHGGGRHHGGAPATKADASSDGG